MSYWISYFLILFIGGGGVMMLSVYFSRNKSAPSLLKNSLVVIFSLFLTFMAIEFYCKVFFAQPDALDTLARQNWRERYANKATFNSLGYRDVEWTDDMVAGRTKIMVVGDSFVYGDGIENPEDRFSNQLAQKLGDDYVVFNVGKGGTNTKHHIQAILDYPYSPDILILSYFVNDITGTILERQWIERPRRAQLLPEWPLLVDNSYAFNFLYWRLYRILQANQPDEKWAWYLSIYNDPESWWLHQQQLLTIYEGTQSERIPLLVVVFPSMDHTEDSQVVTERIIDLFQERDVPTLDVANLIGGIPTRELVASPVDTHPSEFVHGLVADALYELLVEQELISK
jgi:hypothetical protein